MFIVLILYHWKSWSEFYGISLCVADAFLLLQSKRFFPIVFIPIYLFLLSFSMRNAFLPAYILKGDSRKKIFKRMIGMSFLYAIIYACFCQVVVAFLSKILFSTTINWHLKNSFYYFTTLHTSQTSIWFVLFFSSLMFVLFLSTMGTLLIVLRWATDRFILSWVLESILCLFCVYTRVKSPFNIFGIEHPLWNPKATLFSHAFLACGIVLLLFGIGLKCVLKKDFLN